jgi:hypothetical protein
LGTSAILVGHCTVAPVYTDMYEHGRRMAIAMPLVQTDVITGNYMLAHMMSA